MKNDPLDPAQEDSEVLSLFRQALDQSAPQDGLERIRLATQREFAPLHRFPIRLLRYVSLRTPVWALPLTAAVLLLFAGAGFHFRSTAAPPGSPLDCPHGDSHQQANWRRMPASVRREFQSNPDRFQRVCHCTPRFSGNLRIP